MKKRRYALKLLGGKSIDVYYYSIATGDEKDEEKTPFFRSKEKPFQAHAFRPLPPP